MHMPCASAGEAVITYGDRGMRSDTGSELESDLPVADGFVAIRELADNVGTNNTVSTTVLGTGQADESENFL